ncbi:MAG: hypothetical protein R3B49_06170 [Phycisphaerales bacterium]
MHKPFDESQLLLAAAEFLLEPPAAQTLAPRTKQHGELAAQLRPAHGRAGTRAGAPGG